MQDKPLAAGPSKLKKPGRRLRKNLSVRGEFGYWVLKAIGIPAQRPSWNYRKQDGGGIILDMLCHWRYVLDNLFGAVQAVGCRGRPTFRTGGTRTASATRRPRTTPLTRRSNLGKHRRPVQQPVGRARAARRPPDAAGGRHERQRSRGCASAWQSYEKTPKPVWNPDIPQPINFFDGWEELPDENHDNAFKAQ